MTVHASAVIDGKIYADSRSGYKIYGENPTQSQIFGIATKQEYKAVTWQESTHKQFDALYPYDHNDEIGLPTFNGPDGWGMGQLDDARWRAMRSHELQLWSWRWNLRLGVDYMEEVYCDADAYLKEHYRLASISIDTTDDWASNPANDVNNLWDDAFARYHTGRSLYWRNGNKGVINATSRSVECAYVAKVRYHMEHNSWNTPHAPHPVWATMTRTDQCRYQE